MTVFEYLKSLPRTWLPRSMEHGIRLASNAELKRWLADGSILINGIAAQPHSLMPVPESIVFFPSSRRRTTFYQV